jgi:AraC-like DNA-binding protein
MAEFNFNPITPHPSLRPYVAKMYVFESSGRLPATDDKLIVPNANFKLTFTFRNGIVARVAGKTFAQDENKLSLTGLIDSPVMLDPQNDSQTGTILIEFNALGAYRLFRLSYHEIASQIVEFEDLVGHRGKELRLHLAEADSLDKKLQILQRYLIKQLEVSSPDPIYDYCINRISGTNGTVTVAKLEKETGYSARWLHRKFLEHAGTGAKNLAEIIRFKQCYQAYSSGATLHTLREHIYSHYHDQSHFIRAFKRFTGFTPTALRNSMNELATKHYSS